MGFQVSPGVDVYETDLTNIVPNVGTSSAGTVGQFTWGPVEEVTIVSSEEDLVSLFGKPDATNYKDFLCSSSFLSYAKDLKVVRVTASGALNASATASAAGSGVLVKNQVAYSVMDFSASANLFVAKYPGALGNTLGVAFANTAGFNATDSNGDYTWPWHDMFSSAPGTNEYHIVVYDADGLITGTADTALEKYEFVSTTTTAKYYDGTPAYFKTKINNDSAWIWIGKAALLTGSSDGVDLGAGADGSAVAAGERQTGFDIFTNTEIDVGILFTSGADKVSAKYAVDSIGEVRKDVVACVSIEEDDVVNVSADNTMLTNMAATRTSFGNSSYAFMDGAYKYMYDRYNDVNRWIPLNGDTAGLMAKVENEQDAWFSPAGLTKGKIKNAIKLAGPKNTRANNDYLYTRGVNPCVTFPNDGPVLYGDKTLLAKPSAFDRVNVRRLFIVIEKAIAKASRYVLFEQNDAVTRALFVNMVEPFLRDVQGRRGIYDFRVVADETVNTPDVIDRNEFRASIYVKSTKSINFIRLDFIATRTGISLDEIVQG